METVITATRASADRREDHFHFAQGMQHLGLEARRRRPPGLAGAFDVALPNPIGEDSEALRHERVRDREGEDDRGRNVEVKVERVREARQRFGLHGCPCYQANLAPAGRGGC